MHKIVAVARGKKKHSKKKKNILLLSTFGFAYIIFVVLVPALILYKLNSSAHQETAETTTSDQIQSDEEVIAQKIEAKNLIELTNDERMKRNIRILKVNSGLNKSAKLKCLNMVKKDYWKHTAPDGTEPWTFINKAGVEYKSAGENLAYGFITNEQVISGWMNSKTHKANILDKRFRAVGFGICESEDFDNSGLSTIIVQHFIE